MGKLDDLIKIVNDLLTERSARLAFAALLIDIVMCSFIVALLVGFNYQNNWLSPTASVAMSAVAAIAFAIIWFILYIQKRKELTDIYSVVREQISGTWQVKYSTSPDYGDVEERIVNCDIGVDTIEKLEMKFTIVQSPLFSPQSPNVVKDVALRMTETGYKLFYYFQIKRPLVQDLVELLPKGDLHRAGIEIETLGMLEFDRPPKPSEKVPIMAGKWFDLNGNLMRLMKLIQLKQEAKAKGEPFDLISFDRIPVSQMHFDANMGSVIFTYQGHK
jgi:hypothetical protein